MNNTSYFVLTPQYRGPVLILLCVYYNYSIHGDCIPNINCKVSIVNYLIVSGKICNISITYMVALHSLQTHTLKAGLVQVYKLYLYDSIR